MFDEISASMLIINWRKACAVHREKKGYCCEKTFQVVQRFSMF